MFHKTTLIGLIVRCLVTVAAIAPVSARAQNSLDRADPTIVERGLPRMEQRTTPELQIDPAIMVKATTQPGTTAPLAIAIAGAENIAPDAFAEVIANYSGKALSPADLSQLASAVAAVAHQRGYPLATARIAKQSLDRGVLRVTLDEGRIDAVRVVGALSSSADKILTRNLATGRAARTCDLDRAILLVDDLPGLRVKESKFINQDGFGILLVTIELDRASAYVQIDNRGSAEVGPIRSTMLGSVRGVVRSGDEVGLVLAQTPLQPREFVFGRGRYTSPVDNDGSTISFSASYGLSRPGALLAPLNVTGESIEFGVLYKKLLQRSRARSTELNVEFRKLAIRQHLGAIPLRDERLTTLTAALGQKTGLLGGSLESEVRFTAGLPFADVSRQGDLRLSRSDGDARFVIASYSVEWQGALGNGFELALSSAGQVASRPLLATAEIGVGGPQFGRAYEFSERSGDDGIVGGAELRFSLKRRALPAIDRVQLFASVDGGRVTNLGNGSGGGSLLSASVGARAGIGKFDLAVEASLPLNEDRFDSGKRNARLALRLARVF